MSEFAPLTVTDAYDLATLNLALSDSVFAGRVTHFAEIASTNTYAMQAGIEGAPHGSVYVANAQSGGRGRGAHTWASPPGSGLYVSILLRPSLAPGDALWLSLAAGLAASAAIEQVAGFAPDLRWPNDLLAGPRKLGGVLTEMQAEATRVRFVVVGIGINVHQQEFGGDLAQSATSLRLEMTEAPDARLSRQQLLVALLNALSNELDRLTAPEAGEHRSRLLRRLEAGSSWVRGKQVIVGEETPFSGITEGLDARGFLRVRTDTGVLRTVLSGAVRERSV